MIARRPKSAQAMAMRARIVLSCGQGMSSSEVARKLHITGATVGKWRERFPTSGAGWIAGRTAGRRTAQDHGSAN
jgi:transposase